MKYTTLLILLSLLSCQRQKQVEQPIAQVFESKLYRSEIKEFVPNNISQEDSAIMAQNYIRNWITQKLLLHKAIENLSGEESKIQKQVEDYRASLLIYNYKQKLIDQKLEDEVNEAEIEDYYQKNQKNFVLSTPIVKALFFIVPKNAPNLKELRKWFHSEKATDRENLEDYCLTNARKYDNFNDDWIEIKYLLNLLPKNDKEPQEIMNAPQYIEEDDEENYYFLKINDIIKEQSNAPLSYVRDDITLILKNKKKLQFENELERQINEEGRQKNYVKIY